MPKCHVSKYVVRKSQTAVGLRWRGKVSCVFAGPTKLIKDEEWYAACLPTFTIAESMVLVPLCSCKDPSLLCYQRYLPIPF
ncbi:hypothetical protein GQ457_06G027720 [Hibiscus cannabinus]